MSDTLGQDQFQPVVNRRAGYGDALKMALSVARKGGTLSAGEGLLIIEHYEEKLAARETVVEAVERWAKAANDEYDITHNRLMAALRDYRASIPPEDA
jgi:hypothetical protein